MTAISDSQSVNFNSRGLVLLTSLLLVFAGGVAAKGHNSMKPTNKPHVVAHTIASGNQPIPAAFVRICS